MSRRNVARGAAEERRPEGAEVRQEHSHKGRAPAGLGMAAGRQRREEKVKCGRVAGAPAIVS